MDTFYLQIDLGSEFMSTPEEVAAILRRTADILEHGTGASWHRPWISPVQDANGNHVGEWSVVGE